MEGNTEKPLLRHGPHSPAAKAFADVVDSIVEVACMTSETALGGPPDPRKEAHPNCVVCGPENESGLRLEFDTLEDGSVQTHFNCDAIYEGFPGMLHGGVITSLLDGAMTNCLFAHGRTGITGELKVRFCHPVATGQGSLVRAWIEVSSPPFHVLKAELIQDQQVKARATGKFMEQAASQLACRPLIRLSLKERQDANL